MDAKSKANFINAVAAGEVIPCSKCGKSNPPDYKFCMSCGTELVTVQPSSEGEPVFKKIDESAVKKDSTGYVEPPSLFANGLPEWSVEPPQVMVRRH